ncbi:MAG: cell division protein ZipA C-terminal FtsZ-binding domain-containing protein [Pseudomonadota bacterium]
MDDSLQISLVVLGVVVVGVVYIFNLYQDRVARKRLESAFGSKQPGQAEVQTPQVVSIQESLGDGVPLRGVPNASQTPQGAAIATTAHTTPESSESYSHTTYKAVEPEASPVYENNWDASEAQKSKQEPVANYQPVSSTTSSYQPEASATSAAPFNADGLPMPPVDLAIESVARIVSQEPISPTVLQAAMTIPMGKSTVWLGWSESRQQWERLMPQAVMESYRAVIVSILLVDRQGSINDVQLNTFFRLIDNLAKNVKGQCDLPRMETELQRALMLDRRCAELDIQINMCVVRSAQQSSIAATRLRGVAEACGFRWTKSGRFEFFDEQGENLLFVLQNTDTTQPFLPETLHTMQTHGVTLALDVPNVPDPVKAFDLMRNIAKRLSLTLEAVLVDEQQRMINEGSFSKIRQTIEETVSLMDKYQIVPGTLRTLRLFS